MSERTEDQKARSREAARRYRERHPDRAREASQRWKAANPDKVKDANRKPRDRAYEPEKVKAWREQRLTDPAYRERINQQANERAARVRDWLDAYKVARGCVDCGYNAHPAALDFDHIGDSKTINVCNAKSIAQAEAEIAKCEVVCSNCHRIRTVRRMGVRHR